MVAVQRSGRDGRQRVAVVRFVVADDGNLLLFQPIEQVVQFLFVLGSAENQMRTRMLAVGVSGSDGSVDGLDRLKWLRQVFSNDHINILGSRRGREFVNSQHDISPDEK